MTDAPDLSAFWLYPDWDGPLKEPFWMRPLTLPPATNFSGHPFIPKAGCIDLGAFDDEGKPMTRVVNDPSASQYSFDPVGGRHIARSNRPYFGMRLVPGTKGRGAVQELIAY